MKVKDFVNHPEYNEQEMKIAAGLYEGRGKFDAIKDSILRYRDIEHLTKIGPSIRSKRLATTQNESLLSGFINYLTAATCQKPLALTITNGTDEEKSYWLSLSEKLGPLAADALTHANVYRRAFIYIDFPETVKGYSTLQDQKQDKVLDAKLLLITANQVQNWKMDCEGNLLWARVYSQESNESPISASTETVHTWTVIDCNSITKYQVIKKADSTGKIENLKPEDDVTDAGTVAHNTGLCPLVPLALSVPAMDKLMPIAIQHVNRVSNHEYAIDNACFQIPWISSDKKMNQIILDDSSFLQVEKGGSVNITGPSSIPIQSSKEDIERLSKAMPASLQVGSLRVTTEQGNTSRMSAAAREFEFGSVAALLTSQSYRLIQAFNAVLKVVQKIRQEEYLDINLTGLDSHSTRDDQQAIEYFNSLVNIGIPPAAEKYLKGQIVESATAAAPFETRKKILDELISGTEAEKPEENKEEENLEKSKKDTDPPEAE